MLVPPAAPFQSVKKIKKYYVRSVVCYIGINQTRLNPWICRVQFVESLHPWLYFPSGNSSKGPKKDYSLAGDTQDRIFGIFNAVAIIATTYGNGIIPEIQATLAPPVKGKMFKGLCICYTMILVTFFSVAISGYWAFGNQSAGLILSNFLDNGKALLPEWFILMTNMFTIIQLSAVGVVRRIIHLYLSFTLLFS